MILKYISIPELDFSESWRFGWNKIQKLPNFDKYMTFFWLLGPFIYLIERDPADLWLTTLSISFLLRCYFKNDWKWTNQNWFKAAIVFWLICIISGIFSPYFLYSTAEAFVWVRFPLYAAAAQVWLAKDKDIRISMLISILFGMIIMSFILISEAYLYPKLRLTWPYGDLIPGSYLAKTSLPIFCVLCALVFYKIRSTKFIILILILAVIATLLTGERMSFLILIAGGSLAGLLFKPKLLNLCALGTLALVTLLSIFLLKPDLYKRYSSDFAKHIPLINTTNIVDKLPNPYWGSWRSGLHQAWERPVLGIGPSALRKNCKNLYNNNFRSQYQIELGLKWLPGTNYCGNHPHNFYIQLLAETGVIGFIFGTLMFVTIIKTCYSSRNFDKNCPLIATSFIVPLILFFPLQQFGNFFGQWGNLFMWFAIAISIANNQNYLKSN